MKIDKPLKLTDEGDFKELEPIEIYAILRDLIDSNNEHEKALAALKERVESHFGAHAENNVYEKLLALTKRVEALEELSSRNYGEISAIKRPHVVDDGVREQADKQEECKDCNGTGKEICNNPDHGFINAIRKYKIGKETGRLGCPGCGHDPDHFTGSQCETCGGTGKQSDYSDYEPDNEWIDAPAGPYPKKQPDPQPEPKAGIAIENGVTVIPKDAPEGMELKPCPFCGSDDVKHLEEPGRRHHIHCFHCSATQISSVHLTKQSAIAAWNRRAE